MGSANARCKPSNKDSFCKPKIGQCPRAKVCLITFLRENLKLCISDANHAWMMVKPKCVWKQLPHFFYIFSCLCGYQKVQKSVNTFWIYRHGVRNGPFKLLNKMLRNTRAYLCLKKGSFESCVDLHQLKKRVARVANWRTIIWAQSVNAKKLHFMLLCLCCFCIQRGKNPKTHWPTFRLGSRHLLQI